MSDFPTLMRFALAVARESGSVLEQMDGILKGEREVDDRHLVNPNATKYMRDLIDKAHRLGLIEDDEHEDLIYEFTPSEDSE